MDATDEAELLAAGKAGRVLDLGVDGRRGSVDASALRRCCHELKDQIDPRGIRLRNAMIVGLVDLAGLDVPFPLRFEDCEFDSPFLIESAQLHELVLTGCARVPGLLGNGVRVRRDLDLSGSCVTEALSTSASTSKRAAIWLCESDIGGRLLCMDTVIDGGGERSIQADRIHVGGTIRLLHRFTARAEIRLIGARIDGSLDLTGALIETNSAGGLALDLSEAAIDGSIFVVPDHQSGRRPLIRGRIEMGGARIGGQLLIRNAALGAQRAVSTDFYTRSGVEGAALSAPRLSVGAEVTLDSCEVLGGVNLAMSDMSSMSIGANCVLSAPGHTALDLTNAQIRSLLRVDENAVVKGTLRLAGAVIQGTLAVHGQMSQPEHLSLIGGSAMTVNGEVYLNGLRTNGGRVNFRGATLGSVNADGAQLHNPGGYTVSFSTATVKGSVQLADGFTSTGLVVLNRSTIEGRLRFTGGSFNCPARAPHNEHGHAIEVISATVRGGIDLGWKTVSPSVDFTDATTTFLADNPDTWPQHFTIAGLTYDRFETPQGTTPKPLWDPAARCAWLRRQTQFDSGPYEQAAWVFRQYGYTSEAEQILIARQREARKVGRSKSARTRRVLDRLYAIIGYGYRPWRVLLLLAILLALVAASLEIPASQRTLRANGNGEIYTTSGSLTASSALRAPQRPGSPTADSCGGGAVRCFSPVLYAIDTVVPLISLNQRSTWYPDTDVPGGTLIMWWLDLATLLGWLLSSIFAVSLARFSRNQ